MSSTLLLADDSLTIQKVVELTFADTDFGVVAVSSGEELLRQIPLCQPDVVICDVIMPGKDGYQVCQEIKSNPDWLHIPVILLTGTFEPFDRDRALAAGCSEVITKPFEARKLVETVERLVHSAGTPSRDADDSMIEGSVTPSWSDADRPSSGGFQPLETSATEDDFDFGTRLSMPSPEIEPVSPVQPTQPPSDLDDEWAAETGELDPTAAAPLDEPVLAPDDFPEVELAGEDDPAPEGYETTELSADDFENGFGEVIEGDAEAAGSFEPEVEGVHDPEIEPIEPEGEAEAVEEPKVEPLEPEGEGGGIEEPKVGPFAAEPPAPLAPRPPLAVVRQDAGAEEPFTADDSGIGVGRRPAAATEAVTIADAQVTLSDEDVERIARRVLELSSGTLERIAWEVLPDMAELVVRERVRQLEAAVDTASPAEDYQ